MKHYKRILSLLLIFAVSAGIFACGSGGWNNEVSTPGSTAADEATTESVTGTQPEYTNPGVNYNGESYNFYAYQPSSNWIIAQYNGIVSTAGSETGEPVNDAIFRRTSQVEELLNIKITASTNVNGQTAESVKTAVLAGDDAYDAAIIRISDMKSMVAEPGMLIELGTIENLDLSNSWWNQNANKEYSIFDSQYIATGDICMYTVSSVGTLYTNLKMIGDLSLDNPYQLVYNDKWVIDKFVSMCREAAADLNGNSEVDISDRFGLGCSNTVAQQLIICSGIRVSTRNADGLPEITLNNAKTSDIIDSAISVIRDRSVALYQPDYASMFTNVYNELLLPTFLEDRLLFNFNWINIAFEMRSMEADFAILPFPKYDETQDQYWSAPSTAWTTLLTIPASASKTDTLGNVLQAMGYYSQEMVTPAFIDNIVTTKTLRDDDSAYMMQLMYDNIVLDLYDIYRWGNILSSVNNSISKASNTFASDFASMLAAAETDIANTFKQIG
ncbi:MAG: hypothetical protein GX628_00890 [Clostridiales bacterium]|nr:hypothetical protein [Clostridiales bacterium]